jgi:MATE family, multidrug efflux pump
VSVDREIWRLARVLLLAAAYQPVSGVVFVLDGVLIGAGDNRFLAVASVGTTGIFLVCAYVSLRAGGGLTGLWLAVGAFMIARLVALTARARTHAWAVTGARR